MEDGSPAIELAAQAAQCNRLRAVRSTYEYTVKKERVSSKLLAGMMSILEWRRGDHEDDADRESKLSVWFISLALDLVSPESGQYESSRKYRKGDSVKNTLIISINIALFFCSNRDPS